jgi:hypothetical protein
MMHAHQVGSACVEFTAGVSRGEDGPGAEDAKPDDIVDEWGNLSAMKRASTNRLMRRMADEEAAAGLDPVVRRGEVWLYEPARGEAPTGFGHQRMGRAPLRPSPKHSGSGRTPQGCTTRQAGPRARERASSLGRGARYPAAMTPRYADDLAATLV